MKVQTKSFTDFTATELYNVLTLRNVVFVVEQNCAYLDTDGYDDKAHHVLIYNEIDDLAAYCRIFTDGIKYDSASIGRVIVNPKYRGSHLGHLLISEAIKSIESLYTSTVITLSAQEHLQNFYGKHGFETVSSVYLEDNIPHVEMVRKKE